MLTDDVSVKKKKKQKKTKTNKQTKKKHGGQITCEGERVQSLLEKTWSFPASNIKANLLSSRGSLRCLGSGSETNWFLVHHI